MARKPEIQKAGVWAIVKGHIEICRFDHWIKNIFVVPGTLVALAFWPQPVGWGLVERFAVGLLAVGLISSSNYVLNEVLDAPFDLKHPQKRNRAVPSGRVIVPVAYAQWIVLMVLGMSVALSISRPFAASAAALWAMGCLYNIRPIRLKDVPYLDVISESVNNPLRMLAGWTIVNPDVFPSANLLLSYWMLGGYLMTLKRFAEYRDIANHMVAGDYRKSFRFYSENRLLVSTMFYASASMLFLGAFIMRYKMELIFSFPFVAWVMALYMNLAFKKDSAVQAPEKLYREKGLMVSVGVCSVVMVALFFIKIPGMAAFFAPTMPIADSASQTYAEAVSNAF
ncbi:MAG: UbiA prenyltransferase family protein [Alphaproteobacteria bacterium]|nr:UbiA prenyltransferase family protein [Alphaproteobacteria bacterium]